MFTPFNIISTVGKIIYPSLLWNFNLKEKHIYLTFDDGPIPEVTPWVLKKLKEYNAIASFFCIGENITKHPDIFKMIMNEGHTIGNHSYNHLNGWKAGSNSYVSNVLKAETVIQEITIRENYIPHYVPARKLYRPPYGKITPLQVRELEKLGYKIVMWDVISADYDAARSPQKCMSKVMRFSKPGSIIVFHDSVKAFPNLRIMLPEILKYFASKGFEFRSL